MAREDLKAAIGRMLVGRIPGTQLDQDAVKLLENGTMGGICIFKENATGLSQLSALVDSIWQSSASTPIICVDQEGGAVQRFDHILSPLPSAMAVAATGKMESAREIARISGRQLKQIGFNCVLSPVLDVATHALNPIIGTRAFGSNAATVTSFGRAMFESFASEEIVAVGKHFPGHGGTREDSHSELAINYASERDFENVDLAPFIDCADIAPAFLTGHIWVNSLEREAVPATLSRRVGVELLRERLKFDGLVFTDDMMMKAISERIGLQESAVRAIEAGVDVLLLCCPASQLAESHKFILECVESGRLPEKRIHESVARIEKLFPNGSKAKRPQLDPQKLEESIRSGTEASVEISRQAITPIRGASPTITAGHWVVVAPDHPRYRMPLKDMLVERVRWMNENEDKATFEEVRYSVSPKGQEIDSLSEKLSGKSLIFLTFRALLNRGQIQLGQELKNASHHLVAVSCDTPYEAVALPELPTYLGTFDPSDNAMRALAAYLLSDRKDGGTCPVDLDVVASQLGLPV